MGASEPCVGRCWGSSHASAPLASPCPRNLSALSPYRWALLKNLTTNVSSCMNSYSLKPMQPSSTRNARCGAGLQSLTSQPGAEELGASKRDPGNRHYWHTWITSLFDTVGESETTLCKEVLKSQPCVPAARLSFPGGSCLFCCVV